MPSRPARSRALAGAAPTVLAGLLAGVLAACSSSSPSGPVASDVAGSSAAPSSSAPATVPPTAPPTGVPPGSATGTPPAPSASRPPASTRSRAASPTVTPRPPSPPANAGPVTLLGGLAVPWSTVLLPDGSALVSERDTGAIHRVPQPGSGGRSTVVGHVPGVVAEGEGGLLGLAVAPDFQSDPVVYAYFTSENDNRVVGIPWRANALGEPVVILDGIPRGRFHNGGRIAFGPDGYLYVTTGESGDRQLAQSMESLGGKILRITRDGKPAPGNPFGGSPVWSLGHRNVEGLAWDSSGRMYASEFGSDAWDELNVIEPGRNYGWPDVEGIGGDRDFVDPIAQWRPSQMSPSGIAMGPDGAVYMAALRGESVWRVPVRAGRRSGTPTRHLQGTYGRIRDIRFVGGRAWILTSNATGDRLVSLPLSAVGAR